MSDVRRKIILVDDVEFSLIKTKQQLKDHYEVFPAISAAKLFEILERITPDLILLDINMPGVDGYEALRRLKADERYSVIPVIFITSRCDEESVFKGLSLGAADHISKPITAPVLIERIENQLKPRDPEDFLPCKERENTSKPIIIAVDDSPPMLRSIHYTLRNLYRVYTLPKPDQLAKLLQNVKPDLFLLDCQMPMLDGYDLIPIIREFPEHKETPILFLTSKRTSEHISSALEFGVREYIIKPFNPKELREKIAKHIKVK